jgi:hypothetical protein
VYNEFGQVHADLYLLVAKPHKKGLYLCVGENHVALLVSRYNTIFGVFLYTICFIYVLHYNV